MQLTCMALDPLSRLQSSVFTSGRGFSYFAQTPGLPLSLKCMFNGRALYRFDRAEVAVDDSGYLILNNRQPYSIEISSPTCVETFVLWFPDGWAEEVMRSLDNSTENLLAEPVATLHRTAPFFSHYTRHDRSVSPKAGLLRAAFKSPRAIDDGWLEEQLRDLLAAMLSSQRALQRDIGNLPAARASTRQELWKRVILARDYLHAHLNGSVGLSDLASIACLSPFHLLRVFQSAFRQTPHQYLTQLRLERAKFLLEKTAIPVSEICLHCGFTSLGSFGALFRRSCGMSPRAWRRVHGAMIPENSKIRKVFLCGAF
jgi:AraC family transcriptional regulator